MTHETKTRTLVTIDKFKVMMLEAKARTLEVKVMTFEAEAKARTREAKVRLLLKDRH